MGNCLSTLQDQCVSVIRTRDKRDRWRSDHYQLLLKRILLLEEQTAEQEFNMKMLKTQLCHLEVHRLADKRRVQSLGKLIRKTKENLEQSPKRSAASLQEMEYRMHEIEDIINKDLRLKIEVHGSLLRELHRNKYHEEEGRLIDILERGIKEGKKHLENLQDLFDPVRLLMDSDNSLRQLMQDEKHSAKKPRL